MSGKKPAFGITAERVGILLVCVFLLWSLPAGKACFAGSGDADTGVSVLTESDETTAGPINASGSINREPSVDPVGHSDGYLAVLYDNTNGLPTSEANAIAETREGFIWIGSYSGLIRYDGNTFERMDSTSGITSVKCLFIDSRDRLWIGTNDNGIAVMEQGEFRRWGEADGLPASSVRGIAEDANGWIYIFTTSGVRMLDDQMQLCSLNDPRVDNAYMHDVRIGSDGLIYGLTTDGDAFTIRDGQVEFFLDHSESAVGRITCLLPDPENPGYVFAEVPNDEVVYGNLTENFTELYSVDTEPLSQIQTFESIGGRIWICARNGIGVLDDAGMHVLEDVPMNNSIGHMMTDYEGNLWFTSTRQGVMKIVPNQFLDLYDRYGLPENVVNSTCLCGDLLFVATDSGLTVLDENGVVSDVPLSKAQTASGADLGADNLVEMLDGCRIRSVIRDSSGRIWLSTWRSFGLLRYDHGELTAFSTEEGLFSDRVRAVCERKDGSILVANTGGVCVIEGDRVTQKYGEADGIDNTDVLTVAEGENGDIIIGSDGGGIYIVSGAGVKHIGSAEGLTSGSVMRIRRDEQNGVYWVVTGNSIAYITQDYRLVTIQKFPYSNNFDLYENSRGEMWILASNGIYVIPVEELLANGDVMSPVHYGMSNGLPCITTANSYSELAQDGTLYIAGNTGVAKVNIEAVFENVNQLKAAVPYVDADGVRIYPDERGVFIIGASVRKLTIYSYVYNYSLVNPQVSFRLDGFDRETVTVSRTDLVPADYTNLPGGTYHFILGMSDAMGHGQQSMSVQITKVKALYEQVWFYFLIILAAAAALIGGLALYVRKLEQKHKEAAEKEQIRAELHMGNQIQASMLPHTFPPFPDRDEFDIYASMDPAKEVGGDFYDFFLIDEDHLCFLIADVSGKGIPAALFMMVSEVILKSCAMLGQSPADILNKTNEALCTNNPLGMFVTVWVGVLEISTGRLTAANAGHDYPALMKDGTFTLYKDRHGCVIGSFDDEVYEEYELMMEPGMKLFIYTDGVTEAMRSDRAMFGMDRMVDALNEAPEGSPEQVIANMRKAVDDFVGDAEQFDDLTMLCLEYKKRSSVDAS